MSKLFILFIVIVGSCQVLAENDQSLSRKSPFKHHHGLWHHRGLLHYWAFLAIKVKIIFLIGTFFSFWVFAGKAFAFLYYISRKDKCNCHEHDYHGKFVFGDEPEFQHKRWNLGPPQNFLQNKLFYNKPPQPLQQKYSTIKDPNVQNFGDTYQNYGRSFENSFFGNINVFKDIISKVDLTETAFDEMNLKDGACKRRFVCETDQWSKNNSLMAFSLHLFSDVGLMKYRGNSTIEDCVLLGPHCNT